MGYWKVGRRLLFYLKIVFSYEAHFWLNEYVNKQGCRFGSGNRPEELQKPPMHPEKSHFGAVYGLVPSLDRTSSKKLQIVS